MSLLVSLASDLRRVFFAAALFWGTYLAARDCVASLFVSLSDEPLLACCTCMLLDATPLSPDHVESE